MRQSFIACTSVVYATLMAVMPVQAETGSLTNKRICLDPGQAGSDPGAIYNDGSTYHEEADVTHIGAEPAPIAHTAAIAAI